MATIRKLPSGRWNAQIRSKGKIVASSTHSSREAAVLWADAKQRELQGEHPFFLDAGLAYCNEMLERKPSQLIASNRIERICRHRSMQKLMHEITLQDVNAFKLARLEDAAGTTCRDELMMIRRVFKWYIQEYYAKTGQMLRNPCDLLTIPRAGKPRERVISRDELQSLLREMSPQMAVIVELAFETAMRRGEILKLTKADLFLRDRFLRVVDGKEGSRDVPLTTRAVELLQAASSGKADLGGKLFPVAGYSVTQAVRRAREALGMGHDIRFHQLRHSRITEVARMGLNQLQIMMVSGHRDIRSVQRYAHLNVRDVVGLLG